MASLRARTARTQGLTLIELLVAVGLLGVITTYLLDTFTVNQQAYSVVEQVSEVQQNLRAAADLLERDIRHTGFMVPGAAAFCAVDDTNGPDLLYLTDPDAVDPAQLSTVDNGSAIGASTVASGTITLALVLEPGAGSPAYDMDGDGTPDSDFLEDGGVIFADPDDPGRGTACGTVTAVDVGAGEITVVLESGGVGAGTGELVAIPAIEYRLGSAGGPVDEVLLRNNVPLVRGVDDFQVAFQIDLNDDYVDDPNEMRGDGSGPDYVSSAVDASRAREIRANLVLRTRGQDPGFVEGQFQALENRTAITGNDGFRRRVYTAREVLRNVVMR